MRIAVLGTGIVGQTLGARLAELHHQVVMGTRSPAATLARDEHGRYGTPPFNAWLSQHPRVELASYAEAARFGELVINATSGAGSLNALQSAGASNLADKILIDVANPLEAAPSGPPALFVANTDSLAEQIQRAFPYTKVVKTLNTVTARLMVNPRLVAGGEHTIFVSGNDAEAKKSVCEWLEAWFGWKHILDLGDITTARGMEMYMALWLRLAGALGTGVLNIHVVKGS